MSAKSVTTDSMSKITPHDYLMAVSSILKETRAKSQSESEKFQKLYDNLIELKDSKNIRLSSFHMYLGQIKSAFDQVCMYTDFSEKHLASVIKFLEEKKGE